MKLKLLPAFVLVITLACTLAQVKVVHTKPIHIVHPKGRVKRLAASGAHLTYNGGPLIQNVEITTIFVGPAWASDTNITPLNNFFKFAVSSSMIDNLSEYSTNGMTIGHGKFVSTITDTNTNFGSTVDDSQLQTYLQGLIANGTVSKPDNNSLYFIFVQNGTSVTLQGQSSCIDFCGYHDAINGQGPYYAIVPYPSCAGCSVGNGDAFSAMTVIASHEFTEAVTDPIPGNSWYDNNNGEIGDICEGTNKTINR